ncbi:hypothetical protein [Paraliomyxa miuraensis]|uniref:hypothetical protein n=2 Tax=Paraliomyxa miuraensis TaxID=376150 RepID=UPI0022572D7F|nr:hypothetical protein [Paraliomyxa miuraensis]MCX4247982.1 hypothetical protein [Paraliomyxa miuraensis]
MAKKRIGDKAERVLKLLLGLRNKKIASALASRGFGKEDLEEGLSLLRGVTDVSLAVLPPRSPNPAVIEQLDRWENEWFPVANATLLRHYPEIHARVFLNLSQTAGAAVVISVGTFVERVAELTRAEGGHGQAGKDARKLLQRRGLTPAVIAEAKELLEQVSSIEDEPAELPDLEEENARLAEAEDAMWAWYLEWSEIARSAIKDRNLLRRLGFLNSSRRAPSTITDEDDEDDEAEDAAEPTPTSNAA